MEFHLNITIIYNCTTVKWKKKYLYSGTTFFFQLLDLRTTTPNDFTEISRWDRHRSWRTIAWIWPSIFIEAFLAGRLAPVITWTRISWTPIVSCWSLTKARSNVIIPCESISASVIGAFSPSHFWISSKYKQKCGIVDDGNSFWKHFNRWGWNEKFLVRASKTTWADEYCKLVTDVRLVRSPKFDCKRFSPNFDKKNSLTVNVLHYFFRTAINLIYWTY